MKIKEIKEMLNSLEKDMTTINEESNRMSILTHRRKEWDKTGDEGLDSIMLSAEEISRISRKYIETNSILGKSVMGGNNHGPWFD